jgi:hypothetical protein
MTGQADHELNTPFAGEIQWEAPPMAPRDWNKAPKGQAVDRGGLGENLAPNNPNAPAAV